MAARDAAIAERDGALASAAVERNAAQAATDARVDELDRVGRHLAKLVVERDRELQGLRAQIDEAVASARRGATPAAPEFRVSRAEQPAPESSFGVRPAAPPDRFEGMVQLEIGPLSDFSQLVGFEDAAGAISAASEISVTRFSSGRASLDVRLSEPVDLLRELEQRSPFDFRVRSVRDGRLILDLGDGAEAA